MNLNGLHIINLHSDPSPRKKSTITETRPITDIITDLLATMPDAYREKLNSAWVRDVCRLGFGTPILRREVLDGWGIPQELPLDDIATAWEAMGPPDNLLTYGALVVVLFHIGWGAKLVLPGTYAGWLVENPLTDDEGALFYRIAACYWCNYGLLYPCVRDDLGRVWKHETHGRACPICHTSSSSLHYLEYGILDLGGDRD